MAKLEPVPFAGLTTAHLFDLTLRVPVIQTPGGPVGIERRVGLIEGGAFVGPRLSGVVLAGGDDWQTVRTDRAILLDARIVLETVDGATIGMIYTGIRHGPPDVMARLGRGEEVDPASYYFRIAASFTTSDPRHDWLNHVVAVGSGHRLAEGPIYSVYQVA